MVKRAKLQRKDPRRTAQRTPHLITVDDGGTGVVFKLKLEHLIVLEALEKVNYTYNRVASNVEIVDAIHIRDKKRLEQTYANKMGTIVSKILELLRARGLVFVTVAANERRFYGSTKVLSQEGAQAPLIQSRRSRVFGLVCETVAKLGRAVRLADVMEHASTSEHARDISPTEITRDVLSLHQTGELNIVARLRGDGKGISLYLPSELDPEDYMPAEPLTWLERVANAFNMLWDEHVKAAAAEGLRPRPISTGEVRAWLKDSGESTLNLNDPMFLINALQQLARTSRPIVRKIKRGDQKAVLWVPIGVKDEELRLGDIYISDMERVAEAVKRAVKKLGRPVNSKDLEREFETDPCLRPAGERRTFELLSELVKGRTYRNREGGYTRPRIFRAGRIVGRTYYCADNLRGASAYILLRQLDLRWAATDADNALESVERCILPSVALGKVLLLATETEKILKRIDCILENKDCDQATLREAKDLRQQVSESERAAQVWLSTHTSGSQNLPREVSTKIPGWTGKDIFPILIPFCPMESKTKSATKTAMYLCRSIRRIPNPGYQGRFSDDHGTAVEFLFDRTEALLYIARQWGGHECCLQAMIAKNELGLLRDPRFVFPALESSDFEVRLTGVACLAFLWSEEGNRLLKDVATSDPDFGVRQSALWAYAFARGEGAVELASNLAEADANPHVRSFAKQMLEPNDKGLWAL